MQISHEWFETQRDILNKNIEIYISYLLKKYHSPQTNNLNNVYTYVTSIQSFYSLSGKTSYTKPFEVSSREIGYYNHYVLKIDMNLDNAVTEAPVQFQSDW